MLRWLTEMGLSQKERESEDLLSRGFPVSYAIVPNRIPLKALKASKLDEQLPTCAREAQASIRA